MSQHNHESESWWDGDRAFARSSKTLIEQIDHELAEARRWAQETGGVTYVDASKVPAQCRHHDRANMAPVLGFAESAQFGQPRQELVPLARLGPGGDYVWCVYPTDPAVASDFNAEFDAIMRGRAEHCNRLGLWIAMFISVLAVVAVIIGVATALGAGKADPYARVLPAIVQVESGGDASAVGDGGRAVGILQIHPVTVEDANRIARLRKLGVTFTLEDRLDAEKSRHMFRIVSDHYSAGAGDEVVARRWNGGPKGEKKAATAAYWAKVQAKMIGGSK